jgi:hypothetical protein
MRGQSCRRQRCRVAEAGARALGPASPNLGCEEFCASAKSRLPAVWLRGAFVLRLAVSNYLIRIVVPLARYVLELPYQGKPLCA